MKILLFVFLVFAFVSAFDNSDDFINEINSKQDLWVAGRNFPENTPLSKIQGLFGMRSLPEEIKRTIPVKYHDVKADELPETFDARQKWPKCKTIKEIADQSNCGSCWAVATASSISDRICIHSDGKLQPEISARNILSCQGIPSAGCNGGSPYYAWKFWKTVGIVTGGPYGSNIGCQPYPFPPCDHHAEGTKRLCPNKYEETPKCVSSCDNSTLNFKDELYYGSNPYLIENNEEQIKADIYKNGPVVAGFTVYEDFIHYKSGVYVNTTSTIAGSHAVRMIGWGEEKGTKYWLITNSWNEDFGEKGLFKIRRGVNECKIESFITGGLPERY